MVNKDILARFVFDGSPKCFYTLANIEKLNDHPGYVYFSSIDVRDEETLNQYLSLYQEIEQYIEEHYSKKVLDYFNLLLNRYLIIANKFHLYFFDLDYLYFPKDFSINDSKIFNFEDIEKSLRFFIQGVINQQRISIDFPTIYEEMNEEDYKNEDVIVLPLMNDKGVIFKDNNGLLEASFAFYPKRVADKILEEINSRQYNASYVALQIKGAMEHLIKHSVFLAQKITYHMDDILEAEEKLLYDWSDLVGIDISSL